MLFCFILQMELFLLIYLKLFFNFEIFGSNVDNRILVLSLNGKTTSFCCDPLLIVTEDTLTHEYSN